MNCYTANCVERVFITTGKKKYALCWSCMQDNSIITEINLKIGKEMLRDKNE